MDYELGVDLVESVGVFELSSEDGGGAGRGGAN